MDWKKLLGEGAKEMLQGAALGAVKEMGKVMVERDEFKRRLDAIRNYAEMEKVITGHALMELCEGRYLK